MKLPPAQPCAPSVRQESPPPLRRARPTIGLLTYGAGDPNNSAIWAGAADAAQTGGADLICFPGRPIHSRREFEAQANILYEIAGHPNVDGLVIWLAGISHWITPEESAAFVRQLQPLPLVTIGMSVPGAPSVTPDNYGATRAVIEHLIQTHQRSRVAFIRGPAGHTEAEARYRAYQDALAAHDIPYQPELIAQGDFKENGGAAAVEDLLRRGCAFEALAAASDNMALGAMKALQARGMRIPDDVAVTGLNDEPQGRYFTPPLTTGALKFYEQAYQATEMLLALLAGRPTTDHIILPAQLLVRRSCGCPDPVVSRIAGAEQTRTQAPPAGYLSADEDSFLHAIGQTIGPAATETTLQLCRRLWRSLLSDIHTPAPGALAATLTDVLVEGTAAGIPLSVWHDALTALWRAAGPAARQALGEHRAESLWQQARAVIGETAQRIHAYRAVQAQEEAHKLGRVTQSLSATVSMSEMADILATALPDLGISSAYISLYEDPATPTRRGRLILAYNHQGRMDIPPEGMLFPTRQLIPAGMIDSARARNLVVQPLCFRNDHLGLAVFEANPQREEMYQQLAEEISGAIKRTQLVARNVALYEEAEKARREAEAGRQLAEEANRLKSHFLATISHELRTPLSLIVGTIDLIRHETNQTAQTLPESLAHDLTSIHLSAQHLARLINDVLDLASGQAGELRLTCEPLTLHSVLAEAAALGESMAREKGLAWRTDFAQNLPIVWADRTRIRQVILNLISNAVKFTERGMITLSAETSKKQVLIAVTDTGIGIPPDEQELIFDEFRQTERSTRRGYGGMGLGLAISRRLVEMHGGQIGVISTGAEDAGSTFYFTLPVMVQEVSKLNEPPIQADAVALLTKETGDGAELRDYLSQRGFKVRPLTADDDGAWLNQITTSPPGALVIDYRLAVENGWEILHTLKTNHATSDLPLLFYNLPPSGESGTMVELDHLTKPVEESRLVRALLRQGLDPGTRKPQVILIVEDEPAILKLHTRMVRASLPDCRILQAANGVEALQLMEREQPSLVLLDLMMPVMDGFTVLEKMRASPRTTGIPVIVLTAQILTRQDMERLQQGVAAVLSKDVFTTQEVLKQIENALARHKRLGSEAQRFVRMAMACIHERYAENLSRADLAAQLAINERYLTRCFREQTGLTPFVYLTRYRLKRAGQMLIESEMSVTEVALAAGFSDPAHFCRLFKKETGMTPTAYRQAHRQSG